MKDKLLGYYNYTVILTYVGMLAGFTGITCAMDRHFYSAMICLIVAGVCDMFDGAVASTKERTKQEKCFGIQIDSLSDLICFGVLPATMVYGMNDKSIVSFMFAALYVLCALIRLAFFNVDEQERQQVSTGAREFYYGLPVTLSALILPITLEISHILHFRGRIAALVSISVMSVLFVLPFRLKKPKIIGKLCVVLCGVAELALLTLGIGDV